MDQERMVTTGRELVDALDHDGLSVSAAVWVHDDDSDTWKLWIAPQVSIDQHDFYLKVAQTIATDRSRYSGLDVADTELVARDHPAIRGARYYARVTGASTFRLKNNMFDGFYLTDGVIVSLDH